MTSYEWWSVALTALYDLLTLGVLAVVAYEALIKPKQANLVMFFQAKAMDTKEWGWVRQTMDFVVENRGPELRNIVLSSNPDFLGWGNLGRTSKIEPRATSSYFAAPIPYLSPGERYAMFWCDLEANKQVVEKPFELAAEYDNPAFPIPRRQRKILRVDFSAFREVIWGLNDRYHIHNVAQELARIRGILETREKA